MYERQSQAWPNSCPQEIGCCHSCMIWSEVFSSQRPMSFALCSMSCFSVSRYSINNTLYRYAGNHSVIYLMRQLYRRKTDLITSWIVWLARKRSIRCDWFCIKINARRPESIRTQDENWWGGYSRVDPPSSLNMSREQDEQCMDFFKSQPSLVEREKKFRLRKDSCERNVPTETAGKAALTLWAVDRCTCCWRVESFVRRLNDFFSLFISFEMLNNGSTCLMKAPDVALYSSGICWITRLTRMSLEIISCENYVRRLKVEELFSLPLVRCDSLCRASKADVLISSHGDTLPAAGSLFSLLLLEWIWFASATRSSSKRVSSIMVRGSLVPSAHLPRIYFNLSPEQPMQAWSSDRKMISQVN